MCEWGSTSSLLFCASFKALVYPTIFLIAAGDHCYCFRFSLFPDLVQ